MMRNRSSLLKELRHNFEAAIGLNFLPRPAWSDKPDFVSGPRAGSMLVNLGMDNGAMYQALHTNGKAKLRQVFPGDWLGRNEPTIYQTGRWLALEAPWPNGLQVKKRMLSEIGNHPHSPGTFVLGENQRGKTITLKFNQRLTQNALFAGMSGSGKTTSVISLLTQLSRNEPAALFIVCDGKGDLQALSTLRGLVGPLARKEGEIVAALRWAHQEMKRRNDAGGEHPVIYVVWDEPGAMLAQDKKLAWLFYELVSQCRSANIHVIVATQSPHQDMFGVSETRPQMGVSLCGLVRTASESKVAIGASEPQAHLLTDSGDAYIVAPLLNERVLMAFPDDRLIDSVLGGKPLVVDTWPVDYDDIEPTFCPSADVVGAAVFLQRERKLTRSALAELIGFSNGEYGEIKAYAKRVASAYDSFFGPSVEK